MKKTKKRYYIDAIGIIVGAAGGYAYYHYIGCASGSCPLTSNPYISVLVGGLMGYLFFDIFKKKEKKKS